MSSGMHLTKSSKGYINIALERLAEDYDEQGQDKHAEQVRELRAYVEQEPVSKSGLPAEEAQKHQAAIVEAMQSGNAQAANAAQVALWEAICRYEPDPPKIFAQQQMFVVRNSAKQTAHVTVFMTQKKLEALIKRCETPTAVFEELNAFLQHGLEQLQEADSESMWAEDEDLQQLIEEAQAQQG